MKRLMTTMLTVAALAAPAVLQAQRVMTLRECIDYAVSHNIQIKQQDNARRQQELALNSAKNERLPQLSASASQSFNFGRGLTVNNTYASRNTMSTSFGADASLPLFTGFRIPNQTEQARLNLEAAKADLEKAREDLGISVTQAYLQVLYQKDLWKVSLQQIELSRKQLSRMEALLANQKASAAEVSQARSTMAQDELAAVQAENSYKLALLDLSQLLELPSPDSIQTAEPSHAAPEAISGSPEEAYQLALTGRPAITAGQMRIDAAEKAIKVARAGYWPTLSLGAGIGTSYYKTSGVDNSAFTRQMKDNFTKYIGLNLAIPIFDRHSTRNSIRQAKLEYENRQLELDNTKKTLYKEIQTAWYNARAAEQKYRSSLAAENAADDAFQLMEKKYENGKANATEYDEARTNRLKANYDRIAALYEYQFRSKILDFYKGKTLE